MPSCTGEKKCKEIDSKAKGRRAAEVVEQRISARMPRRECPVEVGVVGDDLRVAREFDEPRKRFVRRRRISHVLVMDVRQVGDIFGNGLAGVHERHVPIDDLTVLHSRGSDLGQLIMVEGKARRLRVDHDDVLVEIAEIGILRILVKMRVTVLHPVRRSIADKYIEHVVHKASLNYSKRFT